MNKYNHLYMYIYKHIYTLTHTPIPAHTYIHPQSQAAKVLGSVDFLGNPLGLFNDVTEGIYGLIDGNVGGLFKSIAHGVSNSAAKVNLLPSATSCHYLSLLPVTTTASTSSIYMR